MFALALQINCKLYITVADPGGGGGGHAPDIRVSGQNIFSKCSYAYEHGCCVYKLDFEMFASALQINSKLYITVADPGGGGATGTPPKI